MGLALLAIIWLITFLSTYFFVAKTWWLPVGASAAAPWIDHQFALTYVLMGIVFVAGRGLLGFFVWEYRDPGFALQGPFSPCHTTLRALWTIPTWGLFICLDPLCT